ncbi:FTR1 family iron permease [Nonomuraea basaltis]|nr:FTR1 family iron permease [Nonomuraea basaltis]
MVVPAAEQRTWNDVVDEMQTILDKAYELYRTGDQNAAKAQVDIAYFGHYEKLGFEKTVMSYISGDRAAAVEYQFSAAKKAMADHAPDVDVRDSLDTLASMLREDANRLDGTQENATAIFLASLLIILREGFEAILVVGAIIAYLIKSGNKDKVRAVYWGALAAGASSVLLAFLLDSLPGLTGASQEIIEGATMLLAAAMLIYVSNWLLSKAESQAWSRYIRSRADTSLSKGSLMSLATVAFLAVFREGAEIILFYQALLGRSEAHLDMVGLGVGLGAILLVIIYVLIRVLSLTLPLKPFFLATSILLAVLAFSFVGTGVKELQEGNVIPVSPVPRFPSADLLGVYPTIETLTAQALVLTLLITTALIAYRRGRRSGQVAGEAASMAERS